MTYEQSIELGFKRINLDDEVFFAQYGYQDFVMALNVDQFTFEWRSPVEPIRLYVNDKLICEMTDENVIKIAENLSL